MHPITIATCKYTVGAAFRSNGLALHGTRVIFTKDAETNFPTRLCMVCLKTFNFNRMPSSPPSVWSAANASKTYFAGGDAVAIAEMIAIVTCTYQPPLRPRTCFALSARRARCPIKHSTPQVASAQTYCRPSAGPSPG